MKFNDYFVTVLRHRMQNDKPVQSILLDQNQRRNDQVKKRVNTLARYLPEANRRLSIPQAALKSTRMRPSRGQY